ncbi:MAG: DNA primase [Paludibacteraceae bacterium]|nr:DNA primase [Paludibacteraceae bacterium]
MIPRETINRIFETAKIEEVVGRYVTLKKHGANLIGLCPFHNEKTGSFTVSPAKGIYKCFGCSKAGNAVGFIMEIEQCSYVEALRSLAQMYHITFEERKLTQEEQQKQDDRESMLVLNDFANNWFQQQLTQTPEGTAVAMSYLRQRGLREDTIKHFQIGYSPEKAKFWEVATKAGYKEKYLTNDPINPPYIGTGICAKSQDGRMYDRFRGRVMFPFISVSGKIVGFAGRLLVQNDKAGKYVNSPTSLLYEKHNELFGLYQAKQEISRQNSCYLVEGQMDVIQMVQSGIKNVVASGGTALTANQLRLIHRFTENIILLYDGDKAGIKAALRGIDMMLEEGLNVRIILLPEGEDPDSYARKHNASDLEVFLQKKQQDFIQFKTKLLTEEAQEDPTKRSEMITAIARSIAVIPDIIKRQIYVKDTASLLGFPEEVLAKTVSQLRRKRLEEIKNKKRILTDEQSDESTSGTTPTSTNEPPQLVVVPQVLTHKEKNILNLLQVVIRYGEHIIYQTQDNRNISAGEYIIHELRTDNIEIENPLYKQIFDEFSKCYKEGFVAATFFQHHPDAAINQFAAQMIADKYQLSRIFSRQNVSENVTQIVEQDEREILPELISRLLLELKYTIVNERIDALQNMLKEAQERGDWELQAAILQQQPALHEIRSQLCKALGNRVIV